MSMMRCPNCERIVDTDDEPGEEIGNMRRLMIWVCTPCAEKYHDELEAQQDAASKAETLRDQLAPDAGEGEYT